MPVTIRLKKNGCVEVRTPNGLKAQCTTMKKAKRQRRLLQAIEHGFKPTRRSGRKRRK